MTKQQRMINSVVAAAKTETTVLPWQRGSRRAAFIAKRQGQILIAKSA